MKYSTTIALFLSSASAQNAVAATTTAPAVV
jgi:hypothetical protein